MAKWRVQVQAANGMTGDTGVVDADDEDGAKRAMLAEYQESSPVLADPVFLSVEKISEGS
jgi:hypothetical protein